MPVETLELNTKAVVLLTAPLAVSTDDRMKTIALILGLVAGVVLISGCSKGEAPRGPDDFKVTQLQSPVPDWTRPTDCRANIRQVICLVDPVAPGNADRNANINRACDPQQSLHYAPAFEALYDSYPPQFQKMFCSLRRIFVERGFYGSAYAGRFTDENHQVLPGAVIGVRQSLIEVPMALANWATWKEQLNFGGSQVDYTIQFPFPKYEVSNSTPLDFMGFVFAHEFGHLFDFANGVNQFQDNDECVKTYSCLATPGTWSAISWKAEEARLPSSDFAYSTGFCFYECKSTLSPLLAADIYDSFLLTNFISTYAASNPFDDFAETLAYNYALKTMKKSVTLSYGPSKMIDVTERLKAPLLKSKLDYVESFLQGGPKYP